MSAEVENGAEEEKSPPPKDKSIFKTSTNCLFNNWHIGFKILELVISATCIGCVYYPLRKVGIGRFQNDNIGIMYTTYIGSIVTIVAFALGRVLKERLGFKTSVVFSFTYALLFLVTGILLIVEKSERTKLQYFHPTIYLLNLMIIAIVFSFFGSLIHLLDGILTLVRRQNF